MYEQQFNPYGGNLSIVKGFFKGGKILALGIFYIISVVFSIILSTSISYSAIVYRLMELFTRYGVSVPRDYAGNLVTSLSTSSFLSAIMSAIIPTLTAVCFFIIYVKSRNAAENSSPIMGFTILHVMAIISLVLAVIRVIVIAIAYIIIFASMMTAANRSSGSGSATGAAIAVMAILGFFFAVYCFLAIYCAVSRKNFYRSAKRSITTVNLENKGAAPFGVFNILLAISSAIMMIFYMVALPSVAWLVFATYVSTILVQIFTAIMALGYSKYINIQKNGINTAPYGGVPYQPAPSAPMYNTPSYPQQPQPQQPPYQVPNYQSAPGYQNEPTPAQPRNAPGYQNEPTPAQPQNAPSYQNEPTPVQPQALYCPNCGAKTEPNAPFCPNCGTKI